MTSFGSGKKVCNSQIRYHFQYNSCVKDQLDQLGRKIPNFIPCQEVEKWQQLIVSIRHMVEISEEIAVYAYGKASNVNLEVPRCF